MVPSPGHFFGLSFEVRRCYIAVFGKGLCVEGVRGSNLLELGGLVETPG